MGAKCKHYWECSDVPGIYTCQCSMVRYFNRETGEYNYGNV